ncbi:probable polygalacturonase [Zingiber officinale]|uniref:probable polygalacturonase n=1 Tax=Zingiber officinale TaxID=94328 RepID=UPI001C4DB85D|nr:probable polygalacturonase [Zingiber officinale]XP_042406216.1 probable polygalacturonase [Zingiber officinale]XP_042406217.1 probable polygalacturonase [Zingiber officinale]
MAGRLLMARLLLAILLALLQGGAFVAAEGDETCSGIVPMKKRGEVVSITDFGGVGDGRTLNTEAFVSAVAWIEQRNAPGGTLLYVPSGVWLTGAFNLTSHMTLFLAQGAVISATQDTSSWPLIDPLPSYGRGRELPGGRYMSFIHGNKLHDVIITGENGTIDGQGDLWWNMWRRRNLRFTRPNLLELMHSTDIIISNVVFLNSPFWNIHPVYCSNVVVRNVTILAPHDSPNTDGVDPDSSLNVCIEDSYISTGDDLIAIKSGWDEYGMAYAHPSSGITVRRITGSGPFAGFAIGSETSGGIANVLAENLNIFNTGIGIHIKTNSGRGGFIRNITVSDVNLWNVRKGLRIAGNAGDHPDDRYNTNALPVVDKLTIKNVWGVRVLQPGSIQGIKKSPFTQICLSNIKLDIAAVKAVPWICSDVSGGALEVQPAACTNLTSTNGMNFCTGAL